MNTPTKADDRLVLNKTIYIKRKGLNNDQLSEILRQEAETHIRNNPDLVFIKVGKAQKNADLSTTFPMLFDYRIKYQKP